MHGEKEKKKHEWKVQLIKNYFVTYKELYCPYMLIQFVLSAVLGLIYSLSFFVQTIEDVSWKEMLDILSVYGKILSFVFFIYMVCVDYYILQKERSDLSVYEILGMDKKKVFEYLFKENFILVIAITILGACSGILLSNIVFCFFMKMSIERNMVFYAYASVFPKCVLLFLVALIAALVFYEVKCWKMPLITKARTSYLPEKQTTTMVMIFSVIAVMSALMLFIAVILSNLQIKDYPAAFYRLPAELMALCAASVLFFPAGSRLFSVKRMKTNKYKGKDEFFNYYFTSFKRRRRTITIAVVSMITFLAAFFMAFLLSSYFEVSIKTEYLFPNNIYWNSQEQSVESVEMLKEKICNLAEKEQVPISQIISYKYFRKDMELDLKEQCLILSLQENEAFHQEILSNGENRKNSCVITCMMLEDYNQAKKKLDKDYLEITLEKNEVLFLTDQERLSQIQAFSLENRGEEYRVQSVESAREFYQSAEDIIIVVPDKKTFEKFSEWMNSSYFENKHTGEIWRNYQNVIIINFMNISKSSEINFAVKLNTFLSGAPDMFMEVADKSYYQQEQYKKYSAHIFCFAIMEIALVFCILILQKYAVLQQQEEQKKNQRYLWEQGMEKQDFYNYYWKIVKKEYILSVMTVIIYLGAMLKTLIYMVKIDGNADTRKPVLCSIFLVITIILTLYILLYLKIKRNRGKEL